MITGNIKDAERYYSVNPNFKKVFEHLKTLSKNSNTGTFEGDGFKCNCVCVETLDGISEKLEAHREYIDIHYVIDGFEAIGYANIDTLEVTDEYNAEDDYLLLKGDMSTLVLKEGDFCIVFPEDAHAPAMRAENAKNIKKAIVKIKDIK